MSVHTAAKPITVPDLRRMKGTPQVWLTAYTTPMAQRLDQHCDALLVGDSLGMVLYGLPSTLAVTLDMMIGHGAAVVRGARRACVVVDLPFGSYQQSPQQAFCSAARVLAETGASAGEAGRRHGHGRGPSRSSPRAGCRSVAMSG